MPKSRSLSESIQTVLFFLEHLKEEQEAQELNLRLLRAGAMTTIPQRQRYKIANEQLTRLRQLLDSKEITAFDFCRKCAAITISQK